MQNNCGGDSCYPMISNGEDIIIDRNDCELQVDLTAQSIKNIVIWGHVVDCNKCPITNALVKLFQYADECGSTLYSVCHTFTDCKGYYQFDLPSCRAGKYRILVSKTPCHTGKNYRNPQDQPRQTGQYDQDTHQCQPHCDLDRQSGCSQYYTGRPNNVHYY